MRLGDRKHGHEAAVTAARQTQPSLIDRRSSLRRIDAAKDVAQISITEIAHVRAGKTLALPEAAARVRIEDRPAAFEQIRAQTLTGERGA